MFFQHVLKGVSGLTHAEAEQVLNVTGIRSNWLRTQPYPSQQHIADRLTAEELTWHLTRYDETDVRTGMPYGDTSPFISTTAGTSEQRAEDRAYIISGFETASWFATDDYTGAGWIFYGYVFTLGRPSLAHLEFAEEVRDLHVYPLGYPFHDEGEIVAKLVIPPSRLSRCERYDGPALKSALSSGVRPAPGPGDVIHNTNYADPLRYVNLRSVL